MSGSVRVHPLLFITKKHSNIYPCLRWWPTPYGKPYPFINPRLSLEIAWTMQSAKASEARDVRSIIPYIGDCDFFLYSFFAFLFIPQTCTLSLPYHPTFAGSARRTFFTLPPPPKEGLGLPPSCEAWSSPSCS